MARKVKTIAAALASSSLISTPAWPSVSCADQRHLPLELEEILSSQIVLVRNFFPSKIRTAWKTFLSSSDAIALSPSPPAKRGEAQRTNSRFSVQDAALAAALWTETGLRELVQGAIESTFASCERPGSKPSGLNSNIRIYRYEPGQNFSYHYDESVKLGSNHTEWTLLIYLSGGDEVTGGETAFYPSGIPPPATEREAAARQRKIRAGQEDVVVDPEAGMALLHRHGNSCLLHEGRPVLRGVKWVLRSDIVFTMPT